MPLVTLPPHQQADLHRIQRGMLRELAEALGALDAKLSTDLKKVIVRLDRAGWNLLRVRVEVERVIVKHWQRVGVTTVALIRDAERHAETYMRRLAHFGVHTRNWEPIAASKVQAWQAPGRGTGLAESVLAYVRGKPAGALKADRGKRVLELSQHLHDIGARESGEVTARVVRAIREGQSLDFASRELVTQWGTRWKGPIGAKAEFPKLINNLKDKIDRLGKVTGDDLKQELRQLRRYITTLKPGGRMRAAYSELITDLSEGKAAKSALDKWGHQKQRYLATRIIETEQQEAFRAAQIERGRQMPWLVGYRWHMNRTRHQRFLRSKPGKISGARAGRTRGGRIKGLAGKHCICEAMDGTVVSREEYESQWRAGGHPHCCCFFEEVFDREKMFALPETASEAAWLDAMGFAKAA